MQIAIVLLASTLLCGEILAQESPLQEDLKKALSEKYKGKSCSPYAERAFPNELLWGDSHMHTGHSFDAGTAGCILIPEDVYRFALGEEAESTFGIPVRLLRPLDWLAVADHTDNMGFVLELVNGDPTIMANPPAKVWHNRLLQASKEEKTEIAYEWTSTGDGNTSIAMHFTVMEARRHCRQVISLKTTNLNHI